MLGTSKYIRRVFGRCLLFERAHSHSHTSLVDTVYAHHHTDTSLYRPPKPIHWLGAFLLRRSAVLEGSPSPTLSSDDEQEDEDPDADGDPDTEDHFSTRNLLSPSQNEHRSWTHEPESQNQTLIAEHGHKSSYALDDSVVEAGELEQDGDVQMCDGQNDGDGEDELGHAALIDMSTSTEMDGVNEAGLGFGDEGILAQEPELGGHGLVW